MRFSGSAESRDVISTGATFANEAFARKGFGRRAEFTWIELNPPSVFYRSGWAYILVDAVEFQFGVMFIFRE